MTVRSVITSTFHIRRGRADDSAALTALARRSKARWGYPVEWLDAWSEDLTLLPHCIERHETFVAEVGADIVGVAVLQRTTYGGELEHVWVHPDHEGRGIGRALVTAALEAARRAGCRSVRVLSDPFAEPFYRRLNAQRVGAVPAPHARGAGPDAAGAALRADLWRLTPDALQKKCRGRPSRLRQGFGGPAEARSAKAGQVGPDRFPLSSFVDLLARFPEAPACCSVTIVFHSL